MSTTELPPLVARLMTEADQCRNDGADDIARLLDEAVRELQGLQVEAFAGQSGQGHLGALVDDLRSEIKALHVTEQNLREQLAAQSERIDHLQVTASSNYGRGFKDGEQMAARVPDGLIALLQKRASDSYSCSLLAKDALSMLAAAPQPVAQECEWTNCPRRVGDVCCNEQPVVHPEQKTTGHDEADKIVASLLSADPDFNDCNDAAALIQREIKGPAGFATWRDAAIAERMKRVATEQNLREQLASSEVNARAEADRCRAEIAAHVKTREQLAARVPEKLPPYQEPQGADYGESYEEGYISGWNACIDAMLAVTPQPVAQPEQPAVQGEQPSMSPIGKRKLDSLTADGYSVCGVMIARQNTGDKR